jgi:monofunctional biosynthetic peptidoglycan transglycosylase
MERSDPTPKAAADPASAKADAAKPAADGTPAPEGTASDYASDAVSEPIFLETVSFDPVERDEDTTQPVWRGEASNERPGHDVPSEPEHAGREAMAEDAPSDPVELSSAPAHLWDDVPEDVLETTWPLWRPSQGPTADAAPSADDAAPESTAGDDAPSEGYDAFAPAPSAVPIPVEPTSREPHAAEPMSVEPGPVEPIPVEPVEFGVYPEPQPPTPTPPPASIVDDAVTAPQLAWNPAADGIAAPVPAQARAPAPHPLGGRARDTTPLKDVARRTVRVAALVFGAWLSAVLVLILVFRFVNPPASTLMALRWISGTSIQHEWVPLERISPNLIRAVIVAEDGRFCQHWGVDFVEVAKAIERATDGYPRGASTITMQVAKNLFLLPVKSYLRKVVEVPLTFAIEFAWPKWRILEVYLNIAEWGPGIFGAEAAAQAHFNRPASRLSTRQAAQLAVVLPNPIARDAGSPGPRSAHRASVIQTRAAREPEAAACIGP